MHPDQPTAIPDRHGDNLFLNDPSLAGLLRIYLPDALYRHLEPRLSALGAAAGGHLDELARAADRHPPTLNPRTRTGQDRQSIDKHPAFIELERLAFSEYGLAAQGHRPGVLDWPERLPRLAKYAFTYLLVQAEFGLCCPLSMTDSLSSTLSLHGDAALIERYLPALLSQDFEQLCQGAMFITEQGAGSDVSRWKPAPTGRTASGGWKATNGSAPIRTPARPWCWPMSTVSRTVSRALACSCCRVCCLTASPTATASSA